MTESEVLAGCKMEMERWRCICGRLGDKFEQSVSKGFLRIKKRKRRGRGISRSSDSAGKEGRRMKFVFDFQLVEEMVCTVGRRGYIRLAEWLCG